MDPVMYHELTMVKGDRSWYQFLKDELLLQKTVTKAKRKEEEQKLEEKAQVESIPEPAPIEDSLQVIARERQEERQKELATCYVCDNEFPATELTTTLSGKLLCPDCKEGLVSK
jgi:hypothetical protein